MGWAAMGRVVALRLSPESDPRRQVCSLVTAVGLKRPGSLDWAGASPPLPACLIGVRRLRSEDGGSWWSSIAVVNGLLVVLLIIMWFL